MVNRLLNVDLLLLSGFFYRKYTNRRSLSPTLSPLGFTLRIPSLPPSGRFIVNIGFSLIRCCFDDCYFCMLCFTFRMFLLLSPSERFLCRYGFRSNKMVVL